MTSANSKNKESLNGSAHLSNGLDPWEQSRPEPMVEKEPLTSARLTKDEAEHVRQNIANEILEAAKTVCGELIADTERTLEKARYLEGEADRKHVEAHEERERAIAIRQEAEEYREALIEDVKRQSSDQLERARSTAERECSEMKSRASIESEKMMAQAQVMRSAALEELEAQKIYAEAARFQAASQETLNQARNRLDYSRNTTLTKPEPQKAEVAYVPPADPIKNNLVGDPGNDPSGHQAQIDRATAMALGGLNLDTSASPAAVSSDAMDSLEQLRSMQQAASKAVDAAVAEDRKPAKLKKATKSKKTTAKKP